MAEPEFLKRHKEVFERHKSGETYVSIAASMGISVARTRQLAARWVREVRQQKYPSRYISLPPVLWDYVTQLGNGDWERGINLALSENMTNGRTQTEIT